MLLQLPPATPPAAVVNYAPIQADTLMAECEKGSRDCFPEDRVGVVATVTPSLVIPPPDLPNRMFSRADA